MCTKIAHVCLVWYQQILLFTNTIFTLGYKANILLIFWISKTTGSYRVNFADDTILS